MGTPVANLVVDGLLQEPLTIPTGNTVAPGQALVGTVAAFEITPHRSRPGRRLDQLGRRHGLLRRDHRGQRKVPGAGVARLRRRGDLPDQAQVNGGGLANTGTEDLVHGVAAVTTMNADQSWVNATYKVLLGTRPTPAG